MGDGLPDSCCRSLVLPLFLFPELVDQFRGYHRAPLRERSEAEELTAWVAGISEWRLDLVRQCLPGEVGEYSPGGFAITTCELFGCQENIVSDIECGAFTSDATTSGPKPDPPWSVRQRLPQ